jgi:hypothetical protein
MSFRAFFRPSGLPAAEAAFVDCRNIAISLIMTVPGGFECNGLVTTSSGRTHEGCSGLHSSALFPAFVAIAPHRLRTATQERKDTLRVFHEVPLFMMVAVVLQVSQTTVNCRFSRIHALSQLFRIQLYNGSGVQLIPRLRFCFIQVVPDFFGNSTTDRETE